MVDELDATRAAVKVVIVDACRNNPLRAETSTGTRELVGSRGGLAQVTPPSGTIISYSADAGQQANDGLFTRLLVEQLTRPGQTIMETFAATRETVLRESTALAASTPPRGVRHEPAEYVKLNVAGMRFSFAAGTSAVPGPVPMVPVPVVPEKHPLLSATKDAPWVNHLGMEFIPLPGSPGVFMCRTETRVRDFEAFVNATGYDATQGAYTLESGGWKQAGGSWRDPRFPASCAQTADHPVTCVSWEDARAFNDWLSRSGSGLTYRLPSDAEWSAAVGVGKYPWGGGFPPPKNAGNYAGSEANIGAFKSNNYATIKGYDDGSPRTSPVGSYGANRFGFFDLDGNVWEWCEDRYKAAMNDKDALEEYPFLKKEVHDDGTPYRVLRGGSWADSTEFDFRSSSRYGGRPSSRNDVYGFRCVVSPAR